MTTSSDDAWERFKQESSADSMKKASLAEKLDIIAAQLNAIQTDSRRTAEMVPKIMGDESALASADAMAPPMAGQDMGAMPAAPMGGEMPPMGAEAENPGVDPLADGLEEPEASEEPPLPDGGPDASQAMPEEMMPPEAAPPMSQPMPEPASMDAGSPPVGESPGADVDKLIESLLGEASANYPQYSSDSAFEDLIATMTEEAQEALDAQDFEKASEIMSKLKALQAIWGQIGDTPLGGGTISELEPIDLMEGVIGTEQGPMMKSEEESKMTDKEPEAAPPEMPPADAPLPPEAGADLPPDVPTEPPADAPLPPDIPLEAMAPEGPAPDMDPVAQGLMEVQALLETGKIEEAQAIIAALLGGAPEAPMPPAPELPPEEAPMLKSDEVGDEEIAKSEDGEEPESESIIKGEQIRLCNISDLIAQMRGASPRPAVIGGAGVVSGEHGGPNSIKPQFVLSGPVMKADMKKEWEQYKLFKSQSTF